MGRVMLLVSLGIIYVMFCVFIWATIELGLCLLSGVEKKPLKWYNHLSAFVLAFAPFVNVYVLYTTYVDSKSSRKVRLLWKNE